MQTRTNFLDYIRQVQANVLSLNISDNGLDNIKQQISGTELIVPIVGGFSAGKSTLINSFLGNDILSTAVTPETALATELRYADASYIEAVNAGGQIEHYEIADFAQLKDNAQNFKNLRLYLNNENRPPAKLPTNQPKHQVYP